MNTSDKKHTFLMLMVYIMINLVLVVIGNFYLPILNIRFLNEAIKSYTFFYSISFIVLVIFLPKRLFNWKWNELHISLNQIIWTVLIFFIWISAFLISDHLIFQTLWRRISIDFLVACFLGLTIKAFVEEFIYREIIFKKFTQIFIFKNSLTFSIFLSSFLFSAAHIPRLIISHPSVLSNLDYLIVTFLTGASLCIIYYHSKNFLVLVLLHSFINIDYEFLEPLGFKPFGINEASTWLTIIIALVIIIHNTLKNLNGKIKTAINLIIIIFFIAIIFVKTKNESIIEYYENGQKKATLEDSFLTEYDLKGRPIAFGKYQDGKKVGNWFEYDTTGTMIWQGEYPKELK